MKKTQLTLFSTLFLLNLNAQLKDLSIGTQSGGLGNTINTSADVWSVIHNPSKMLRVKKNAIGINYSNHFLIPELSQESIAGLWKYKNMAFGISYIHSGNKNYQNHLSGLSYGIKLHKKINIGVKLNYLGFQFNEFYGRRHGFYGNISLNIKANEQIEFGVNVFNVNALKLADYTNERLSTLFNIGLQYHFSNQIFSVLEIEKDLISTPNVKLGIAYQAKENIFFRVGFSSFPSQLTFGYGMNTKVLDFGISSSYQFDLGFQPQASLVWNFN